MHVEKGKGVKESSNCKAAPRSTCQMSAMVVISACDHKSAECQQLVAKEAGIMELGAGRYIENGIIASQAVLRSMSKADVVSG